MARSRTILEYQYLATAHVTPLFRELATIVANLLHRPSILCCVLEKEGGVKIGTLDFFAPLSSSTLLKNGTANRHIKEHQVMTLYTFTCFAPVTRQLCNRQMTQSLVDCKSDLLSKTEALEHKQQLLEEIKAECQRLKKEKRTLLEMIQSVQRDIDAVSEAELLLGRERDELQCNVNRIQTEQYDPLHGSNDYRLASDVN